MNLFRIWLVVIGVVLVVGFTAAAFYLLWMTLSDPRVNARGGFYYVLGALGLALGAFLGCRAFLRWASRRGSR